MWSSSHSAHDIAYFAFKYTNNRTVYKSTKFIMLQTGLHTNVLLL